MTVGMGAPHSLTDAESVRMHAHLEATMNWLRRAQDVRGDGVSAGYTFLKGWAASFPETTGYIIPSFINHYHYTGSNDSHERALRMAAWLLELQHADGWFPGGLVGQTGEPSVFNTGQIVFGLVRAAQTTGEDQYLSAAQRAGDWLVSVQERTGEWIKHDFLGKSHVYNTRTAWALLVLDQVSSARGLEGAAARNLDWALANCGPQGFPDRAAFDPLRPGERTPRLKALRRAIAGRNLPSFYTKASLHTVAYTIQGLLESAWLLGHAAAEESALRGADVLAEHVIGGTLAGFYGPGWKREASSLCLTGVAQMAIVWLRLLERGQAQYLEPADRALSLIEAAQDIAHRRIERRGAIAGSEPVWGLYLPFRFPNWAAKFAADAYMLRLMLSERRDRLHALTVW